MSQPKSVQIKGDLAAFFQEAGAAAEFHREVVQPTGVYANAKIGARAVGVYMKNAGLSARGTRNPGRTLRIITGRHARAINARREARIGGGIEGGYELASTGPGEAKLTKWAAARSETGKVYSRAVEEGFTGTVQVPAHTREINKAFTRQVQGPADLARVRAYSYQQNIPARPTLAPAMKDETPNVVKYMRSKFLSWLREVGSKWLA